MLNHIVSFFKTYLLTSFLGLAMLLNNACVNHRATSYDQLTEELKTYSPEVTIEHENGESYDLVVTAVEKDYIQGYSTNAKQHEGGKILKSSIVSLTHKQRTKLAKTGSKVGQGALIGTVFAVAAVAYGALLLEDSVE